MSQTAVLQQLATSLKITPADLPDLSTLSNEQLAQLAQWIATAQQQQRQDLSAAIDRGLDHVPALLRGAVKKIVKG